MITQVENARERVLIAMTRYLGDLRSAIGDPKGHYGRGGLILLAKKNRIDAKKWQLTSKDGKQYAQTTITALREIALNTELDVEQCREIAQKALDKLENKIR